MHYKLHIRTKMSNEFFKFKQFTVFHDRCAMKVGTDGVLLGAWAPIGKKILDIGTGTGLISLMMAQRSTSCVVDGVEIDDMAVSQALSNVKDSPFASNINIIHSSLNDYFNLCIDKDFSYDCIVSNPPFYTEDTSCPDDKRDMARHTSSLPYSELFRCVSKLLSNGGSFSIIVPYEAENKIMLEASVTGLFVNNICYIRTTPRKGIRRILMTFSNVRNGDVHSEERCLMNADGSKSEWYKTLTNDFYL